MTEEEMIVGEVYVVAGQGPMVFVEPCGFNVTMERPSGQLYVADWTQIIRIVDVSYLTNYLESGMTRVDFKKMTIEKLKKWIKERQTSGAKVEDNGQDKKRKETIEGVRQLLLAFI